MWKNARKKTFFYVRCSLMLLYYYCHKQRMKLWLIGIKPHGKLFFSKIGFFNETKTPLTCFRVLEINGANMDHVRSVQDATALLNQATLYNCHCRHHHCHCRQLSSCSNRHMMFFPSLCRRTPPLMDLSAHPQGLADKKHRNQQFGDKGIYTEWVKVSWGRTCFGLLTNFLLASPNFKEFFPRNLMANLIYKLLWNVPL